MQRRERGYPKQTCSSVGTTQYFVQLITFVSYLYIPHAYDQLLTRLLPLWTLQIAGSNNENLLHRTLQNYCEFLTLRSNRPLCRQHSLSRLLITSSLEQDTSILLEGNLTLRVRNFSML